MRVGWNPLKRMRRRTPQRRVTVATLTHIPLLAGYYAQSLDVLRLMLASLRAHTAEDVDLMVFDNASCPEARQFLAGEHEAGRIQFLTLSRENVGMLAAQNILMQSAPGEFLAYADGDVFFYPGWLEASLRILEGYPMAGVVTGLPIRHRAKAFTRSALAWAQAEPEALLETGDLIDREWTEAFCEGTGRKTQRYLDENKGLVDHRISYRGVRAYTGASMFQFVGRKSVVEKGLPFSTAWLLRGSDEMLVRLDEQGYLSLATDGLYVHHLGNTLNEKWRAAAVALGVPLSSPPLPPDHSPASRLARRALVRRGLLRLYDGLFRLLYRGPAH
jgi:hypothetical protein